MGYEYFVQYNPPDMEQWQLFLERLPNPTSDGWPAFAVETAPDGIYFCDHAHSPDAAVALRRIIDEALAHQDTVEVSDAR